MNPVIVIVITVCFTFIFMSLVVTVERYSDIYQGLLISENATVDAGGSAWKLYKYRDGNGYYMTPVNARYHALKVDLPNEMSSSIEIKSPYVNQGLYKYVALPKE